MEIKYEAVFGPQELFDGMMGACEFASEEYGYKFANGALYYCERYNEKAGWSLSCKSHLTFKPSAMRRIIRTPTWSVADQKAGKLPEVGAKFKARGYTWECVRILNNTILAVVGDSYCGFELNECTPIESPEEKAARLREEWKNNVIEIHQGKRRKMSTSTFLLDDIYDAMLSGDLPVPVKE